VTGRRRSTVRAGALLLLLAAAAPVLAEHTLAIGAGALRGELRDDLVSRARSAGFGPALALSYERPGAGGRHLAELRLGLGLLTNRYDARCGSFELRGAYGLQRALAGSAAGGRVLLGARLRGSIDEQIHADWDEEHLYWLTAYALGPWIAWRRERGGRQWELSADAALVALTSRPPRRRDYKIDRLTRFGTYLAKPNADLSLNGPGEYTAFTLRGDRVWRGDRRTARGLSLILEYRAERAPRPIRAFSATVLLRLLFPRAGSEVRR
jgi:hypothetical protein